MPGDYEIKDIYNGGYSTLDSNYGNLFKGYGVSAASIGMSTDARTANVLKEISESIASGEKTVELTQVSPEVFEAIPGGKEFNQLKELNRLSKLTGVDITVHAPIVEPSGMTQQGWSEPNREAVERQMNLAIERSHEINPKGNFPVTFHSSSGLLPAPEITMVEKQGKKVEEIQKMLVIDQETGQIRGVQKEEKYYPGRGKVMHTAEEEIGVLNESEWDQNLSQLIFYKEGADRIISENYKLIENFMKDIEEGRFNRKDLTPTQEQAMGHISNAQEYLKNTQMNLSGLFNKAYKYGKKKKKKELNKLSKNFGQDLEKLKQTHSIAAESKALQDLMIGLQKITVMQAPKVHESLDKFSQDKSTTTFANVAWNSYKKFKDKAPIISIENPPAGQAFARGEDLKNIVKESRKKFVEKAVKQGISKSKAEDAAEKLIGVTWDVGHINMMRKFGLTEKDILKETEKVAPLVKHVHLSDNFGFEHTELPMGMGNVPMKKIMKKLEEKGFKGKKIAEAISWWQHFSPGGKQNPPFKPTLQAMGSPVYAMDMQPYWNQAPGPQGYFTGMGTVLPDINYQTFGAGFSQLPAELGGQQAGAQGSRMSGQPME